MALRTATRWDALAHVHYDGMLYNGFPSSTVNVQGASHCAVTNLSSGVVGRGVLLDVARWMGLEWLEMGTAISPENLEEVARSQGVEVWPGDVLLVRTGWRKKYLSDRDKRAYKAGEYVDEYLPLHMIAIRDMGIPLAEILDLVAGPQVEPGAGATEVHSKVFIDRL